MVDNTQSQLNKVVDSLSNGSVEVEKGTFQINQTNKTFAEINEAVGDMAEGIKYIITSNLSDVTENGHVMSQSVQEIATISEQSSASTEETASSMEEVRGKC